MGHGKNNDGQDALQARTCIRTFLTQRAIQSFIFLLVSFRDPHTMKWLESNLGCKNLFEYHGTGALNMTKLGSWDELLIDLLNRPNEVIVVNAKRRSPFRGNNPNRKENPDLERYFEFEVNIDPPSIISRIISVREQIAKEWNVDLDTLVRANDMILTSYFHNQELDRYDEEEEQKNDDEDDDDSDDYNDIKGRGNNQSNDSDDDDDSDIDVGKLTVPYSDHHHSSSSSSSSERHAFDRHNAMIMFSNSQAFFERTSSPLRKDNFDLLLLLSTQESIHRVLHEYHSQTDLDDDDRETCFEWLKEFYISRLSDTFDGHNHSFGRADDFLEELLLTPPSVKKLKNNKVGFIDPLRVAEDIIRMRTQVALDWKEIVQGTPTEHILIRKELLAKQMMGSNSDEAPLTITETEETTSYKSGPIMGNEAFE